jgi:photosystem I subunit 11
VRSAAPQLTPQWFLSFLPPPSVQLGPLRAVEGTAEIAGCLSAAGLVGILTLCLTLYGAAQFQSKPPLGVKTLSGRAVDRDTLQSAEG